MSEKYAIKISYIVNTWLFLFVIGMMLFFKSIQADFLVVFSIPTILVYIINYLLLYKKKLTLFVWIIYFWISLYMGVTTVCLGYDSGFHLYAMSLIPVVFYTEYMAYQLQMRSTKALWISIILVIIYVVSSVTAIYNGAIYSLDCKIQATAMSVNAIIVFSFIIVYSLIIIKMVISSEEKLKNMAHIDKLTGLYNRHYMMDQISEMCESADTGMWIAMIDIDNFKSINDHYGHNAGDFVLTRFSEIVREICSDCTVSRWGGEEYLIMARNDTVKPDLMEKLRGSVCAKPFVYQDSEIQVSITVGVANYKKGMSIDSWIQDADNKLYQGKNSGKNVVIW